MYQTLDRKVGLVLVGEPKEDTENDLYTKCCEKGEHDQYLGIIEKEKLSQPNAETLRRYILLLSCYQIVCASFIIPMNIVISLLSFSSTTYV